MPAPPLPADEAQRLAATRGLEQFDTPTEERFDRITRLARKALDVPIALVSLVDANRQWFKSCQGLGLSETSRAASFCAYAILQHEMLIIPDATQDPRFADNELVTGPPYIRFYAGQPIRTFDNYNVGTLCIIDDKPRDISAEEIHTIKDLASWVEKELSTAKLSFAQQEMIHQLDEPQRKGVLDTTTRLWNQEGMQQILEKQLVFANETGKPFAVVMLDIDHYKEVQGVYGPEAGDLVVVEAAKRIKTGLRDSDAVGRYGDDEFLLILADATPETAAKVCAQVHNKFMLGHFNVGERRIPVRASLGGAFYDPSNKKTVEEVIEAAKKALQQAKDTGRNRVVLG